MNTIFQHTHVEDTLDLYRNTKKFFDYCPILWWYKWVYTGNDTIISFDSYTERLYNISLSTNKDNWHHKILEAEKLLCHALWQFDPSPLFDDERDKFTDQYRYYRQLMVDKMLEDLIRTPSLLDTFVIAIVSVSLFWLLNDKNSNSY